MTPQGENGIRSRWTVQRRLTRRECCARIGPREDCAQRIDPPCSSSADGLVSVQDHPKTLARDYQFSAALFEYLSETQASKLYRSRPYFCGALPLFLFHQGSLQDSSAQQPSSHIHLQVIRSDLKIFIATIFDDFF
ncbi:hypothetical protein Tcan_00307, partial [Toxocara canis]